MSQALKQIVYVSTLKELLNKDQLFALLVEFRNNNQRLNITGMLLYHNQCVMQVIEGDEEPLDALFMRIRRDNRHTGVITLVDEQIEQRAFPEWSMSFNEVVDDKVDGFSTFMKEGTGSNENGLKLKAMSLLESFRKSNS